MTKRTWRQAACMLALAGAALGGAVATTLAPVTLDEQIEESATIFRGRAVAVRAVEESAANGRRIMTFVRFAPVAAYKGEVPAMLELRFLGGKVGDTEMRVDGMPQFEVGVEYVLFVSGDENRACPVIGWSQGSLPIDKASGSVRLSSPVAAGLRSATAARAASPAGLETGDAGLAEFEAALREKIREAGKR